MSIECRNHNRDPLDGSTLHGVYVLSIDIQSQRDRDSPFVRRGIECLGEGSWHLVNCESVTKGYEGEGSTTDNNSLSFL